MRFFLLLMLIERVNSSRDLHYLTVAKSLPPRPPYFLSETTPTRPGADTSRSSNQRDDVFSFELEPIDARGYCKKCDTQSGSTESGGEIFPVHYADTAHSTAGRPSELGSCCRH